jgi:hypothetical protein
VSDDHQPEFRNELYIINFLTKLKNSWKYPHKNKNNLTAKHVFGEKLENVEWQFISIGVIKVENKISG